MKDIIITAAVVAVFVIGFFIIRWLDKALAATDGEEETKSLSIGVSDALTADCLCEALSKFSKLYPSVRIKLINEDAQRLIRELHSGRVDVILIKSEAGPADVTANIASKRLMLRHTPVTMKYSGLPIESITEEDQLFEVLWRTDEQQRHVSELINCLSELRAAA